jgi:hypothetical protein
MDTAIAIGKIQSDYTSKQHQTRKIWLLILSVTTVVLIGLVICFIVLWLQNTGSINKTTNCQANLITYEQINAINSNDIILDQTLTNDGIYACSWACCSFGAHAPYNITRRFKIGSGKEYIALNRA